MADTPPAADPPPEAIEPAKLLRLASMARALLEELRRDGFGEQARQRLDDLYRTSLGEIEYSLPAELRHELDRLVEPLRTTPTLSEPELRVAEAQLSGWLDGLFQGLQATALAQQHAAMLQARQPEQPNPERRATTYL